MKTIMLYGFLGRQFGRVHRLDVTSPAEAIRALTVNFDGFRQALVRGGSYSVVVGGKEPLTAEGVPRPVSDRETIRIVPVIAGAGAVARVILGAVLMVVSFIPGFQFLAPVGASLIIGGVAELLFAPKPAQSVEPEESRPSYVFDGPVNTVAQGNPVPVLYGGPLIIGSQIISAGFSVEQIPA